MTEQPPIKLGLVRPTRTHQRHRASDFEAREPTFVPLLQGLRIQPHTAALGHLSYASLVAGFPVLIPRRMP
jgi:hypothetical protein